MYMKASSVCSGHKIQLPSNWLITKEEEDGKMEAGNNLSNMGYGASKRLDTMKAHHFSRSITYTT